MNLRWTLSCAAFAVITAFLATSMSNGQGNPKDTLVVALGDSPEQVQAKSNFKIPWALLGVGGDPRHRSGGLVYNVPHALHYKDQRLDLLLPMAGNEVSMPSTIGVTGSAVDTVSGSLLGQYVTLAEAITASKDVLAKVEAQGFVFNPNRKGNSRKFMLLPKNFRAQPKPPHSVDSFEDMERVFLNSDWVVEQMVVFDREKDGLNVEVWVTNMRRKYSWSSMQGDAASIREKKEWSDARLRTEKAYYVRLSIAYY